jgi:periplasmic divalent cation tolerance protein
MADFIIVFSTAGNAETAHRIAAALVEARLAACVQVLPIESHYRWEGALCREPEFQLQAKTRAALLPAVEALIKKLHSYAVPEILTVPIIGGSADYLTWLAASIDTM